MAIKLIVLLLITIILALVVNYLRFKVSDYMNKIFLIGATLLLIEIYGQFYEFVQTGVALLLFISIASISFQVIGGGISALVGWIFYSIHMNQINVFILFGYLLYGLGFGVLIKYLIVANTERNRWRERLINNSKQLNVFREVSASIQKTHELDRILHTILTSVTAGHGLGFNRAMIWLVNEERTKLQGIMGVGPMSSEEGYKTWEHIAKLRYRLIDLLEIQGGKNSLDPQLNERVRELKVELNEDNFFYNVLESGKPHHIKQVDKSDGVQKLLTEQFGMEEFFVLPLINQNIRVGILIIDNPVNKKTITAYDIDGVIPLANEAAIAIHQAHLYTQVEDMALKDGLTGLFNQRAFQSILKQYISASNKEQVSLILLDIDFFKHFNDTNGHLLGNEILIQLATIISRSIRDQDYSFRFGGEEFVVILPNTSIDEATVIAERIRSNVAHEKFPRGETQPDGTLTVSLGVASTTYLKNKDGNHLVDAADKALYEAKALGKNKVVSYKELGKYV